MENEVENTNTKQNPPSGKGYIHFVLSHAYTMFLFSVVLGVVFDIVVPLDIFSNEIYQYVGLLMIFIGSFFVYWAQFSSSKAGRKRDLEKSNLNFHQGPYKYLRHPTHFGLFVMTLGLAFIINSPFSIFLTIVAHVIIKLVFIKKEEKLLEKKYGDSYLEYRMKNKKK